MFGGLCCFEPLMVASKALEHNFIELHTGAKRGQHYVVTVNFKRLKAVAETKYFFYEN